MSEYSVETPTTVATVRGTSFRSRIINGIVITMVGDGKVRFESEHGTEELELGEKAIRGLDDIIIKSELTADEKIEIAKNLNQDLKVMKFLRLKIIQRNKLLYSQLKQQYSMDDEGVKVLLSDIDNGYTDDRAMVEQSPVKIPLLYKLKAFNDKVKDHQKAIELIHAMFSLTKEQTLVEDDREILQADESELNLDLDQYAVENEEELVEQLKNTSNTAEE
jgi:hypothetical protein